MRFEGQQANVKPWLYQSNSGVKVSIGGVENTLGAGESGTDGISLLAPERRPNRQETEIMLHGLAQVSVEAVGRLQLKIPDFFRSKIERAIGEFAAMNAILGEVPWSLVSPNPYMALEAETRDDIELLKHRKRIVLPGAKIASPFFGRSIIEPFDIIGLVPDRVDGVMLLASGIRAGGGVATLHELFRVMENAFGKGGDALVGPAATFLESYPSWDLGYSKDEVRFWVRELRHPGTHADLKRSRKIAYDSDIERYLPRIRQAAYDILLNKASWQSADVHREMRWSFRTAIRADGGLFSDGRSSIIPMSMPLDHFDVWPLHEGTELKIDFPEGTEYLLGKWYFSEDEWQDFETDK